MNKALLMTAGASYVLGWGIYFMLYISTHWKGASYMGYVLTEGFVGGMAWPFFVYKWFLYGTPVI